MLRVRIARHLLWEIAMPKINRDGVNIYYEVHGEGPTLLLTHGYSSTSAMWQGQIAALSKHHKLVLWDMRGHGQSDYPSDPSAYSEALTVADMAALLDEVGAGLCGACTVHVNGEAVRSCQTSVSDAVGKKITTIEGLSAKGDHPLQKAWIAEQVPQCGYCQSGQIMQAASLLAKNSNPTKDEVVAHMDGNLCRCMTYSRIQKAIMRAAADMRTASNAGTERRPT